MATSTPKRLGRKKKNGRPLSKRRKPHHENVPMEIYTALVENAAVALWSAPYDSFTFTYVSPEAERIFGYSAEECLQPDFFEKIVLPEEREWVQEYSRLAIQEKHTYQFDYHIITKKGKVRTLRDTVRLTYREGKPYQKIGVTQDISVYHQTIDELHESNLKFYRAFHNFPIPALISRIKDAKVLDVNKDFLEVSGYERHEIVGKSAFEIDAWINPMERDQVLKVLQKNSRVDKYPVLLKDAYSRTRNVLLSAEGFESKGDLCVLLMLHDVTEQIKTEERLQQINRELETFMYKSSHNLKGPVASIKGLIYLSEKEIKDPQAKEYLDLMQKSARGLETTLEELMDIARLKQGKLKIEVVDLQCMLEDISNKLRFMPEWQNVSYKVSVEQKSPFYTDSSMISSILQNLVENAVKYQAEDSTPEISVTATIQPKVAEISVQDNGIGIPEDQLERVFEMFYRAHDKVGGSGLGLYIVRNSIEKLGGSIRLKSERKKGSVFHISLPNIRPDNL